MKESYPHTQTWPYMMSVLLLIGLVLAPPTRWPQTVRRIYALTTGLSQTPSTQPVEAKSDRLVVAFDPSEKKESPRHELLQVAGPTSGVDAPQPASFRSVGPTESNLSLDRPADRIDPPVSDAYVWQPPPNWNPAPIKPLDAFNVPDEAVAVTQSAATAMDATEKPQAEVSAIQPPVANQVGSWIEKVTGDRGASQPIAQPKPETTAKPRPAPAANDAVASQDAAATTEDTSDSVGTTNVSRIANPASTIASTTDAEAKPQTPAASPSQEGAQPVVSTPDAWPTSKVLDDLLEPAFEDIVLKNWAREIAKSLKLLQGSRVAGTADQVARVAKLRELATVEVDRSRWPDKHRTLHDRVRFAVLRRVEVWEPLLKIASAETSAFATYRASKKLAAEAKTLERALANAEETKPWIDYLALPRLREPMSNPLESRALTDAILSRMLSKQLTTEQQQYLRGPEFGRLEKQLRNVIAKSVHPSEVMRAIETYEASSNRTTSNELILLIQRWRSAPNNQVYKKAIDVIISHYRNANLRFAVSEDLINRFVPAFRQYGDRVNERILGAAVTGQSSTRSNVSVKLIPDEYGVRLGLLAAGRVQSNTSSRKGPVTMYNRTQSSFAAGKEVVLRPDGLFVSATETRANSGNQLLGMQTDWDDVPLIGRIVRSVAQQEITDQRAQVQAETQMRVRQQAKQRIDKEIDERVATAGKNLDRNVVEPLRRLELDPKAMELRTTAERVIVRTRLASPWQFAAHSPRPKIRADSKMSLHIHQSAANNIIEQLQLQNRRMTLEELMASLSERFGIPLQLANDEHKDAIIQFAEHPLEFDFNDGQVCLTMHFAELNSGKRVWKDFSIRGYYKADVRELIVQLEREEGIELIGDRIGLRDQIALRGIFARVFGKHTRLQILQNAIRQQPQLQNLKVTQFTIRDGWLALAFGEETPQRLTERSKAAAR